MKKIKVIKFPVDSDPLVIDIDAAKDDESILAAMQEIVGGLLELVRLPDGLDLWCNEEGVLLGMTPNRIVAGHVIHGDFFLARHNEEGEPVSVTTDDIERLV